MHWNVATGCTSWILDLDIWLNDCTIIDGYATLGEASVRLLCLSFVSF